MTALPYGWRLVELGQIASTRLGKMLSKKSQLGSRPRPYLRNRDVQWGKFDLRTLPTMDFSLDESTKFDLRPQDIVVCEGGEVGRAAIWREASSEIHFQKALHRVRCSSAIVPEYLYYLLRHYGYRKAFDSFVTGSTIAHLPQEDLRRIPVPLPDAAEQRRIVEAIEEHFSRLDAADSLLLSIDTRSSALAERSYRTLVSGNWPSVKLSTIARTSSGGTPSRSRADNFNGTIPWVKSGELGDSFVRSTSERLSQVGIASSSAKIIKRGALLMAMYGATVGKLGILDMKFAATNQAVCAIEPEDPELVPFLWLCLRAMRRDLIESAKGGAQPNISQGMIRALAIPMPPKDDRQRLVDQIQVAVSACERVRAAACIGASRSQRLRRAILERAFSGELVPQDAVERCSDQPPNRHTA